MQNTKLCMFQLCEGL